MAENTKTTRPSVSDLTILGMILDISTMLTLQSSIFVEIAKSVVLEKQTRQEIASQLGILQKKQNELSNDIRKFIESMED